MGDNWEICFSKVWKWSTDHYAVRWPMCFLFTIFIVHLTNKVLCCTENIDALIIKLVPSCLQIETLIDLFTRYNITELYWIGVFSYKDPRRAVDVFYDMLCYEKFIKKLAPLSFMACDVIRVIIYSPEGCLTSRIIVLSRVSWLWYYTRRAILLM